MFVHIFALYVGVGVAKRNPKDVKPWFCLRGTRHFRRFRGCEDEDPCFFFVCV